MYTSPIGDFAQITFHYVNGESETYNLYTLATVEEGESRSLAEILQDGLPKFLERPWVMIQLPEESVCIHMHQINRVEVKPTLPLSGFIGTGERLTPLNRNR